MEQYKATDCIKYSIDVTEFPSKVVHFMTDEALEAERLSAYLEGLKDGEEKAREQNNEM